MAGYINSTINETSSSTGKASPQAQQGHKVNKALKALKDQKPGLHMIVRIFPIVSKNVQTIGTIIWKRYPDDRKRPGRLRRPRSLG